VGIELRPLGPSDIPAWTSLLAAVEAADHTGEHYTAADLEEELSNPEIEPADYVGAFDGPALVGYFGLLPRGEADGVLAIYGQGSVLPTHRGNGVGTTLLDAMLGRARERRARRPDLPHRLAVGGMTANASQRELFETVGLLPRRWNFTMRTSLDDLPPAPALAEGCELRRFEPDLGEPMRVAHNEAFVDHPDFAPWTAALWRQFITDSRTFCPAVTFLVTPTGSSRIAAYLQTSEYDGHFQATGSREAYVGKLGTLRAHRGLGLASTLLAHALVAYRDAGYDEAALDVDSANPTGALGIYQRAGFEVEAQATNYALLID
jgi:ribosomal protein S18 acetylase RimI-like enzyme